MGATEGVHPIRMAYILRKTTWYERKFIPIRVMEHWGEWGLPQNSHARVILWCDWPPIYQVIE